MTLAYCLLLGYPVEDHCELKYTKIVDYLVDQVVRDDRAVHIGLGIRVFLCSQAFLVVPVCRSQLKQQQNSVM